MNEYYAILGLKPGVSESEIKKAYRRLARKYHPDVSQEPDAEERFVEISEAYQYLTEKPVARTVLYETSAAAPIWQPPDREEQRRERARRYAQMRYEAFRKSNIAFQKAWYFMPVKILTYTLIYCLYAVASLLLLAPLIAWITTHNKFMTVAFAFFILISSHVYSLARAIEKGTREYFADWE